MLQENALTNAMTAYFHLSILLLLGLLMGSRTAFACVADTTGPASYYFEEDEVVFEFDLKAYRKAAREKGYVAFQDLEIEEVAISGDFNDWSRDGWRMRQVSPGRYQLRKPVEAFDDRFPLAFRYVINREVLVSPFTGHSLRQPDASLWKEVYNIDPYTLRFDKSGNIRFFLPGYPDAGRVVLSGNFNGWDEQQLRMERTDSGWVLPVFLAPGRHEYKFIVDGNWILDPTNPERVPNQYGTGNSLLVVSKEVTFFLPGYADAKKVILSGSFNDWSRRQFRMTRTEGGWTHTLLLPGGKHHYKFIVDGQWMVDPENPIREWDGMGHINSVKFVR